MSEQHIERINVKNYTRNLLGSIHFDLRQRLTTKQVEGLRFINGVTRFEAHDYTVHISIGDAFSFAEVAPRALIIIADALGVDLDQIEAVASDHYGRNEQPLVDQALADAKELVRANKIAALRGEIGRINNEIETWRSFIKQWLARKRQIVRELKKMGETI